MSELVLPAPLPHQVPVLENGRRFKLWRAGRRTGKSRAEMIAAVAGHGPNRRFRGLLQGGFIAWFAPDYKQAQAIWREEIRPRFGGHSWAEVSEVEKRVSVKGSGALQLLSAENIDAARGWKLDGAVMDEGAYWDLEYGWNAVIRPALADKQGWGFFGSTTNAGHDGNQAKRVPSFFNLLCERAEAGELGPDWAVFHNRTEDNPKIPRAEIATLRAEYPEGSATAAQELDAELGVAGGRYFDIRDDVHLVPRSALPKSLPHWWEYWGAKDWGFAHWDVQGVFCMTTEGATFLLDSSWTRRQQDMAQAEAMSRLVQDCDLPTPATTLTIYAGHDCWSKVTARGAQGITTADIYREQGLTLWQADNDRANGGRVLRRLLSRSDETRAAGLYLVDTPNNRRVLSQLKTILPDPNDVNKPWKVDADSDGKGGDDGADMLRYGVASRHFPEPPTVRQPGVSDLQEIAWANARGENLEDGGYVGGVTMDYDPVDYG
jgi:hypothetical protein